MILLYHKVAPITPTIWWVSADTFDRQMAALAAYDVVPLSEYDPANPRHAVITFDGVYENVYQYAFPILRKWGYPFELFVTGSYIGCDNAFDAPEPLAHFCTIEQLEMMAKHGGRLQWHTATHRRLDKLSHSELLREIEVPSVLRGRYPVPHFDWFAYPHGDHSDDAVAAVRRYFKGALSCFAGNDGDHYQLNRVTVYEDTKLDKSRVTVIVANFNYGDFLPDAMESVLKQTVAPDEIILIDDCSTDGSQDIVSRYKNVARVVLNEKNLGIVDNFNKAVSLATGDYIAFLGADNRMRSDYVECCKTALDRHPEAALVYTDMTIFGGRAPQLAESVGATLIGESVAERWPVYLWQFPDPTPEALAGLETRNFMHGSSMYRRLAFDQVGGYRKSNGPEDHNLFKRMLQTGWQPFHVREALIEYRQHSTNQANTVLALQMEIVALRRVVASLPNIDQAISEAQQTAIQRDQAIAQRDQAIVQRDQAIADCHQVMLERDAALTTIVAMRRSSSWRLTAPLRLCGHLMRGNYAIVANIIRHVASRIWHYAPLSCRQFIQRVSFNALSVTGVIANSSANLPALADIVDQRCAFTKTELVCDPKCSPLPELPPAIDISVVTYNSERWVNDFVESLLALKYPKSLLTIRFVDNASTDNTEALLYKASSKLLAAGYSVDILSRPNLGFGAGHNTALKGGSAPFCLITNIDLTFESNVLNDLVAVALAGSERIAAWEPRQKPFEHPKFYDPVTGITSWNSHACVLLRRSALEQVGYYDTTIFMYGEDVELSYRLRRAGFLLCYCANAVVWHYSYESPGQIKPLQYVGSVFANLYLRLKYGNASDALAVPMMAVKLLLSPSVFPRSRRTVLRSLLKLLAVAPKAFFARGESKAHFPFRTWDYEITRDGAFVEQSSLPAQTPLVSVITRTYCGRDLYLRQAMLSVAHQTYPNIEHLIVEDGGDTTRGTVDNIRAVTGHDITFIAVEKLGRSAAGNAGLAAAKGRWCLFLDDDDLLFADHIEVLVNALVEHSEAVAAYSPAWEIPTNVEQLENGRYIEVGHHVPSSLKQPFDYEVLKHHNFMAIQSVLFDRSLYKERGGFEEDMDALEDWVLWVRYAHGNRFIYVPKVTSMFRTPSDREKIRERSIAFSAAYPKALTRQPQTA